MGKTLFTNREITALHSSDVMSWLRQKDGLNAGVTNAQRLYQKIKNTAVSQDIRVKSQAEKVRQLNKAIFQTLEDAFHGIGLDGFADIFMKELQNQRSQKQAEIKQKAIAQGVIVWQGTPVSKDQLEGGVLKGKTERPDLVWEQIFTGVCAFQDNRGAYVLKQPDEKGGFSAQHDINVRLTDDRLEGKKIDDILGYLHGHRLTPEDGFLPTVSLVGEVAPEWVSLQDVSVDESKPVTLRTLVENGVHIFKVASEDLSLIQQIKAQKINREQMTRDEAIQADIDIMEDMARHPEREYRDTDGTSRKIAIKSYFMEVKKQLDALRTQPQPLKLGKVNPHTM